MAAGGKNAGFTIIETLIVLIVTCSLAVTAMLMVSGRQNKTEFMVASNQLTQELQQIINETRSGYYPRSTDLACAHGPSINNTGGDQGKNKDCVFLGKAIAFGVAATSSDKESFVVYPIVGNSKVSSASDATDALTFTDAKPLPVGPNTTNDISEIKRTHNGLEFAKAVYHYDSGVDLTSAHPVAVFGVLDDLSVYSVGDDGLNSGTQSLNLFGFVGADAFLASNSGGIANDITNKVEDTKVLESIDLCFNSGGTDQSVVITVTGRGQLSVTKQVKSGAC